MNATQTGGTKMKFTLTTPDGKIIVFPTKGLAAAARHHLGGTIDRVVS